MYLWYLDSSYVTVSCIFFSSSTCKQLFANVFGPYTCNQRQHYTYETYVTIPQSRKCISEGCAARGEVVTGRFFCPARPIIFGRRPKPSYAGLDIGTGAAPVLLIVCTLNWGARFLVLNFVLFAIYSKTYSNELCGLPKNPGPARLGQGGPVW